MTPRLQTLLNRTLVATFLAMLVAPGLGIWLGKKEPSTGGEFRTLASFPNVDRTWATWRAFPDGFTTWLQDHFGFRDRLIRAHSLLMVKVLRSTPSSRVMLGRDGWLFYNGAAIRDGDPIADFRGHRPLTPVQLETWRWYFEDVHAWCEDHGVKYLLVILPGKETATSDMLPAGLPQVGPTVLDQMMAYLNDRNVDVARLDPSASIYAARSQDRTYLVTDTHWTSYGAFAAYREILAALTNWYPALRVPDMKDYGVERSVGPGGDLARMISLDDVLTEEHLYVRPNGPTNGVITRFGNEGNPSTVTTSETAPGPRTVIFRDSFTEILLPYIAEDFRRAYVHPARDGAEVQPIEAEKPELVLQIITDRMLRQGQRYDPLLRAHGAMRRFESTTNTIAAWSAATGFAGITNDPDTSMSATTAGLAIQGSARRPILYLPPIDGSKVMPVVQVEIESPERTDATIRWLNPDEGVTDYDVKHYVSGQLEPGTNRIHIPLIDPGIQGPLRLDMGRRGVPYVVTSIEVRGVPR